MRLLTAVSGVRVPQQAPESTRKRVLFFYVSGSHPCACNGTRAGKPADMRNRSGRDCAREGEQSLFRRVAPYGGSSPVAGATEHPKTGAFVFISGSHPCACNGTRAGKPADMRNRSGRDCAREGEQSLFRRAAPYGGSSSLANDNDKTTNRKESDCGILLSR